MVITAEVLTNMAGKTETIVSIKAERLHIIRR